jgi:hypothetical protein
MLTQRTAQEQRNYARGVQAYLSGQASPDADACDGWGDAKRAAECTPRPEFLAWANAQLDAARHQITEQQRRTLHAVGHTLYGAGWADKRHALALAVTWPCAGNLAGGGFMLIRLANGTATFIDYRETAPAVAFRESYLDSAGRYVPESSLLGPRAAGEVIRSGGLRAA